MISLGKLLAEALGSDPDKWVRPYPIPPLLYWQRCPCGKVSWPSWKDGIFAAREGMCRNTKKHYVYFCRRCLGWHTTTHRNALCQNRNLGAKTLQFLT